MQPENPKAPAPDKKISDVLLEKAGVISPQDTLEAAGEKLRSLGKGSIPVAESRRLVGMVDEPDADQRAARYGHDPRHTTVRESMNPTILCCFEDEASATALARMDEYGVQILPVVDREMHIMGMISRADLVPQD